MTILRSSMGRAVVLFALLWVSVLSVSAQQVTKEAALKKAEQFFNNASLGRRAPRQTPELVFANNRDEFYVFNDRANGGYVIVSGEERMPDVLAYSYDGRFEAENIPCNMKAWLEGYAEQVKYLRIHPEAKATKRTTPERENVGPLLTCWYHQVTPYNDKCPEVDGKHLLTGCVGTAMAQIMHYRQWPKQTTDVIPSYTTNTLKIEMPEIPVTTIDWDNILGQYEENNYTEKQADAISTLMLLCGTSIRMNYSLSGSGASLNDAAKAFRIYFDYDDMLEYINRNGFNIADWEQLIYDELSNNNPVLYDGYPSDGSGHAFVMDGYENGYFHVNWGWGGLEAYVLMTDAEGWNGYTVIQHAVVGIHPASADYPSRYAVFDNGTMTLYYDKKKSSRSGTVLPYKEDWSNYAEQITECVIDESFANLKQRDLSGYFSGWNNLKSIKGMEYLNTSNTTNMCLMFSNCSGLTSLDVSGFKTDNVTNMSLMFCFCSGLTSLDVSGFKTDNVTNMWGMFWGCSGLTSLNMSGFKTDNVSKMYSMFDGCSSLASLDVSCFKTENVTDMSNMFSECSGLTTIYAGNNWNTDKVENSSLMFRSCNNLVGGQGTKFKSSYTDKTYAHIDGGVSSPGYFTYKENTGIHTVNTDADLVTKNLFDINGIKHDDYKKGLNIIRKSDGTTKKVVVK